MEDVPLKEFYLHKIFNVSMGNGIDAINTTNDNPKYLYITRKENDSNGSNGLIDEIENKLPFPRGSLTLALGGSIGSCYVQNLDFYTGQNVGVLQEKIPMPIYSKLFISTLIRNECKIKFQAFGRVLNSHFRKDFTIKLPVLIKNNDIVIDEEKIFSDEGYIPNWELMDNFIRNLPYGDRI